MVSDEALYARVREGDMRAFDELYARYESSLFGFLVSQLRNRADAEDAFHESFLAALRSADVSFDAERGFKAWLFRIARNLTLNRYRSAGRGARALAALPGGAAHAEPEPPPDEALGERERLRALDDAVLRLPEPLSELFHLRSSGLSYEEMAHVLEIPLGTLKSRMNQMVTQLREDLRPWNAR